MKSTRSRALALIGAGAVVASTVLGAAPPAHAAGSGNLVVTILDQYGRPTAGVVEVVDSATQNIMDEDGKTPAQQFPPGVTHTFTGIPAGGYSLVSISPWSGLECYGVTPCSVTGLVQTTPVVNVVDTGNASYTAVVTVPSIAGVPTAGSTLAIQVPQGLTTFSSVLPTPPGGHDMTQQWVRGATDIAGASGLTYTTVPADGGAAVVARLMPSSLQLLFPQAYGIPVAPLTTNAVTLAKFVPAKTKTKVKLPHVIRAGDKVSLKVVIKAKGGEPDGVVTIKVSRSTVRKTLAHGSAFANLPRLEAGTYKIQVKYSGSDYFAKSRFKKTFTVLK